MKICMVICMLCVSLNPFVVFANLRMGDLHVGVGRSDISADEFIGTTYTVENDILQATAIVFSDLEQSITIVGVDVLEIEKRDHDEIINEIKDEKGIHTKLLINASHGHATLARTGKQRLEILRAVKSALYSAHEQLESAELAAGYGSLFGSLNRVQRWSENGEKKSRTTPDHRFCDQMHGCCDSSNTCDNKSGQVLTMPLDVWINGHSNKEDKLYGYNHQSDPLDTDVGVVHIRSEKNKIPIATIVNYASHPVIVQAPLYITAGYPGYTRRLLEKYGKENGSIGKVIFLQGFAGDIVPSHHTLYSGDIAHAEMSRFSSSLAGSVISVVRQLRGYSGASSLQYKADMIAYEIPQQGECTRLNKKEGIAFSYAVKINEQLSIAAVSGEPFVQLGLDIKSRHLVGPDSPVVLTLGYTNDANAYIPSSADHGTGGYGTLPVHWGCTEKYTGDNLVDSIIEMFKSM